MPAAKDPNIYLALRYQGERSHMEDQLVLDGYDVSTFASARKLWEHFQIKPARFVITDRRFGDDFSGLDLVRKIRAREPLPYVYVLMFSIMGRLADIREGLVTGVDDYLVKPPNPFQIRSRVLVGLRWLAYIDSITWKNPKK